MKTNSYAIIVAAGSSTRYGKSDKLFEKLEKKTVIFHSVAAFAKNNKIKGIIIVAQEKKFKKLEKALSQFSNKIIAICEGGESRLQSTLNGIKFLEKAVDLKPNDIILVHNGANPAVTKKEINECIKAAAKHGAAIVAKKAVDTIKFVKNNTIIKTLPRDNIYLAQTPQAAKYKFFKQVLKIKNIENKNFTDEASFFEYLEKKAGVKIKVKIIPASPNNFKITTKEDLMRMRTLKN